MSSAAEASAPAGFRHEALFYEGEDDFLAYTVAFISDGVDNDEPVLVVVDAPKIDKIRASLDGTADRVRFADMTDVGRNPARIIPTWRDFVNEHKGSGRRLRGIGEPISADRSSATLVECHRHESLLNLAFADSGDWWLLCPYDLASLPDDVVEEALRNHPFVLEDGTHRASPSARDLATIEAPFDDPLSDPPAETSEFEFDSTGLAAVRMLVRHAAAEAGFGEIRAGDLVLAADEVATNSIRHGGGSGVLRVWTEGHTVVCDIHDAGRIEEPLLGRSRPTLDQIGGRGLWLVNELCDLVQIRSCPAGTIVRLHVGPLGLATDRP